MRAMTGDFACLRRNEDMLALLVMVAVVLAFAAEAVVFAFSEE